MGIVVGQIWTPPWHPPRHIRQDACRLWRWVHERVGEHYLVATIVTALRLKPRNFREIFHVRSVSYHTLGWVLYVKVLLFTLDSALEHPISYREHYISSHPIVWRRCRHRCRRQPWVSSQQPSTWLQVGSAGQPRFAGWCRLPSRHRTSAAGQLACPCHTPS